MDSIRACQQALQTGQISAVELTQSYLKRLQEREPQVHSFLTVLPERALVQAAAVDRRRAAGETLGPLAGIPLAVKDNLCMEGVKTTCGSRMLADWVAPYTATAVANLERAGAVILGKTNLDEFAMGSSTENSAFGPTYNPWRRDRVPGGSSGGSAAAVAAGQCVGALGSDTGGSIRQPAAFCGTVGLKPTYGLISRYGLVAFASSLDQVGPLAHSVEDVAWLLQVLAGPDRRDATSLRVDLPDYVAAVAPEHTDSLKGKRVGVVTETFGEGLDSEVAALVQGAIAQLQELGAEIQEISCPRFRYGLPTYYILAPSEASANLARYDGVKYGYRAPAPNLLAMYEQTREEGFGPEVKRRIMMGTYVLSSGYYDAYYLKAQKVRTLIREDFDRAFAQVDVLACPTSPVTAFALGSKTEDPLSMYLTDLMTIPVNLAGLPGLSLPCGFDRQGLPVGLQLIANVLQEPTLLQVARAYERATPWHERQPPAWM